MQVLSSLPPLRPNREASGPPSVPWALKPHACSIQQRQPLVEREGKGPSTRGQVWIRPLGDFILPACRAEAPGAPAPGLAGSLMPAVSCPQSATGWSSLPGPPSLPSVPHCLQFLPSNLPFTLSQGLVPGFWGGRLGLAPSLL